MTGQDFEALARAAVQVGLDHLPPSVPPALRPAIELAVTAAVGALAAALRPHAVDMRQAPGSSAVLELVK